ncbi:organic cation transporter protein-like isoform X2 [Oratosquilla oratoria]
MVIVPQSFPGPFMAPPLGHNCTKPSPAALTSNTSIHSNRCWVEILNEDGLSAIEKCTAWDYDNSTFSSTLTSEFNLVCDDAYLRVVYQSITTFGNVLTDPLSGLLCDHIGRVKPSVFFLILFLFTSMTSCWLVSFEMLLLYRFLLGLLIPLASHGFYTAAMEVCEPKYRALVGISVALTFAFMVSAWGGVAYLIRDWRWLMTCITGVTFLFLPLFLFLSESPRWLIVQGRHQEALKILRRASRWNGVPLPPDDVLLKDMKEIQEQEKETEAAENIPTLEKLSNAVLIMFRTPQIRKITLITFLDLVSSGMVYVGMSIAGAIFDVDIFLYMVITGFMEVPAYSLTVPIVMWLGRKKPTILGFLIAASSLFLIPLVNEGMNWLVITLAMVAKLSISSVFQILFLYSSELFPTEVRMRGFGLAMFGSRIGAIFTPYITDKLGLQYPWMPFVIFGSSCLVSCIATLRLPETQGRPLFEKVSTLENDKVRRRARQNLKAPDSKSKKDEVESALY